MLGTLFVTIVLWLISCLGLLEKGQKFWSFSTKVVTIFFVSAIVSSLFSPKDELVNSFTLRDATVIDLGLSGGLVYCVTATKRIQDQMRFPLAHGLGSLLVGILTSSGLIDFGRWLNKIA